MDWQTLQTLLLWCTLINFGLYLLTVVAVVWFRKPVVLIHLYLFSMEEKEVMSSIQSYLGRYKLMITVFNFVPWLALWIMNNGY
ncbi:MULTISPECIES: DUF6868 family protein [Thiomicrorhabdus]|uniref:DUF6868 domain-containing protein n=1 Tax=Thiomicrorhabdus heinhorstiae TaxID=2748010 RepID=A0ABS0BY44_9GAMM|nr:MULTISPECIES: hypothetical protein [Thiomicrorhabdus]MBF6058705.1 hypothetical protein [Thiomicrorhabdus heinhorstiae]